MTTNFYRSISSDVLINNPTKNQITLNFFNFHFLKVPLMLTPVSFTLVIHYHLNYYQRLPGQDVNFEETRCQKFGEAKQEFRALLQMSSERWDGLEG